ncbi:hypothetical protein C1645_751439 [Glomus cerebriforme]|uniref:Uncharacterized protein n=1 Tax=Glomus cerebriforme TaxID=658196 RepID=A0A397TIV4_9GLOM|nr:hypothetical protein C1645_751439 [Glomus cerebriforme]
MYAVQNIPKYVPENWIDLEKYTDQRYKYKQHSFNQQSIIQEEYLIIKKCERRYRILKILYM